MEPTTINLSSSPETPGPYPLAIFLAISSLLLTLLITPPFLTHLKNRNIGASVLVLSGILGLLMNFLNAIIWSNDDIPTWYHGTGLCDVEIKIMGIIGLTNVSALAMILRGLANVMDTSSANWAVTAAKKRRNTAIEVGCCVVLPLFQVLAQWITQPVRYFIFGIAGCVVPNDGSWLFVLLTLVPVTGWILVDVYYSVLLLIRLIRYRRQFSQILVQNNTTKSRFLRLYLLSTTNVLGLVPVQAWFLSENLGAGVLGFSWNATHHPTDFEWNSVGMSPGGGRVFYDRWAWLVGGFLIFVFFGFGRDAVKAYREVAVGLGVGRVFPSLKPGYEGRRESGENGSFSSTIGSKARLYFAKRKDSELSTTDSDLRSPDALVYSPSFGEKKTTSSSSFPAFWKRIFGRTSSSARKASNSRDPFVLSTYNREAMIESKISAEPSEGKGPGHSFSSEDVMVRTELRQASETIEPGSGKRLLEGV